MEDTWKSWNVLLDIHEYTHEYTHVAAGLQPAAVSGRVCDPGKSKKSHEEKRKRLFKEKRTRASP